MIITTLVLALMPHDVAQLTTTSPRVTVVKVPVRRVPSTPILDFTHPWPVVPGATIRIEELNQTVTTNADGEATIALPLGPTGEAVYTFTVTVPGSNYRSVTRRRVYEGGSKFSLFFDPNRDFRLDYTREPDGGFGAGRPHEVRAGALSVQWISREVIYELIVK